MWPVSLNTLERKNVANIQLIWNFTYKNITSMCLRENDNAGSKQAYAVTGIQRKRDPLFLAFAWLMFVVYFSLFTLASFHSNWKSTKNRNSEISKADGNTEDSWL